MCHLISKNFHYEEMHFSLIAGLWAAKMNLSGTSALATDQDLAHYERKLEALDIELERRKDIGRQFETVLDRQEQLLTTDDQAREQHQVSSLIHLFVKMCLLYIDVI